MVMFFNDMSISSKLTLFRTLGNRFLMAFNSFPGPDLQEVPHEGFF